VEDIKILCIVDIIYIFRCLYDVHAQTARKHAYMHITVSLVSILSILCQLLSRMSRISFVSLLSVLALTNIK